ncbi:hypothetical protein BHM03_00057610 [Ensete ventricosum]|nr:hypothetical protein BHM03_00057610 [Ensete ventricosum]
MKRARYRPRGSSSFCLIPRRDAVVGFGWALARKLVSNSFASWSKEWIRAGGRRLYHPQAIQHKVVKRARHIVASDVSYKTTCALNAATCSIGSELLSYGSSIGSRKSDGDRTTPDDAVCWVSALAAACHQHVVGWAFSHQGNHPGSKSALPRPRRPDTG